VSVARASDEFRQRGDAALAERPADGAVGVLNVHVRRLRQVRSVFGFGFAERLIEQVAERIRAILRPQDSLWHLEAGEFLILLPDLLGVAHGRLAADRIVREFEMPLSVGRDQLRVPLVIGAAFAPDHGEDAEQLVRRAIAAAERALASGRSVAVADAWLEDPLLLDDLRRALLDNDMAIAFQPVVRLADGALTGVEALARWSHPRRGSIAPSWFVPLAEQAGLAPELTRWSLNAALRDFAGLYRRRPELRCAINLSSRVFADPGLSEQVQAALAIWDVPADRLVLEVTETAVMEDPEQSAIALRHLRESGVGIALDDFGRGYSSFQYLKHLPATELKIDRMFVQTRDDDAPGIRLLGSMIDLAHALDLTVIAEGVETEEEAARLRALGCDLAQGWRFGHPEPTATWLARLSSRDPG
jgi:EAL domain-containing protein (putative c-di-GMP-specific phosphodiesterase class I)/GGDEF domain-containing protein